MSEQVIVFALDNQTYGIDIKQVAEISPVLPITSLPRQNIMDGVVNLRGSIFSAVSLRKVFGMQPKKIDQNSRMIILKDEKLALIADEVTTMATIEDEDKQNMESVSMFGGSESFSYIAKWNNTILTVVDIQSLLKNKVISAS